MTDVGPAAAVSGLNEGEVSALRQVGEQWGRAVAGRREWLHALPVDPGMHRFPRSLQPTGAGRFAAVDFVETDGSTELSATAQADAEPSRAGGMASRVRRIVFGAPLASSAVAREKM